MTIRLNLFLLLLIKALLLLVKTNQGKLLPNLYLIKRDNYADAQHCRNL